MTISKAQTQRSGGGYKPAAFTSRTNKDGTITVLCDGDEVADFDSRREAVEWLWADASRLELEARARRKLAMTLGEENEL